MTLYGVESFEEWQTIRLPVVAPTPMGEPTKKKSLIKDIEWRITDDYRFDLAINLNDSDNCCILLDHNPIMVFEICHFYGELNKNIKGNINHCVNDLVELLRLLKIDLENVMIEENKKFNRFEQALYTA